MPAAMLLKKSALAAKVPLLNGMERTVEIESEWTARKREKMGNSQGGSPMLNAFIFSLTKNRGYPA